MNIKDYNTNLYEYREIEELKITLIRCIPCSTSASSFNRLLLWLVSLFLFYFCYMLLLFFRGVHFAAVCFVVSLSCIFSIPRFFSCQFYYFRMFLCFFFFFLLVVVVSSWQWRVALFTVLPNEQCINVYSWDNRVILNPSYFRCPVVCIFVWCI